MRDRKERMRRRRRRRKKRLLVFIFITHVRGGIRPQQQPAVSLLGFHTKTCFFFHSSTSFSLLSYYSAITSVCNGPLPDKKKGKNRMMIIYLLNDTNRERYG